MMCSKTVFALFLAFAVPAAFAGSAPTEVHIPHLSTASGTLPGISVKHGQQLTFVISDTYPECFTYNLKEKQDAPVEAAKAGLQPGEVRLTTEHDAAVTSYEIVIAPRPGANAECPTGTTTYTIPVRPYWNLAATGGFAHDELRDPVYFLEAGSKTENGATKQGFYVRQDTAAEDAYKIGGTAFVHLYHNTSSPVAWVPISFGLGLNNNETRYLLGTSVRFGPLIYLTVGAAFGERKRLPTGVRLGDFTDNANLLATPASRQDQGAFVSISFKFLEQGLSPFKNAVVGKPVLDTTLAAGNNPQPAAAVPSIAAATPTALKADESLTLTGINFGDPSDTSSVIFGMASSLTLNSKDARVTWTKDKIVVKMPDILKDAPATETARDLEVSVKVGNRESEKKKVTIKR